MTIIRLTPKLAIKLRRDEVEKVSGNEKCTFAKTQKKKKKRIWQLNFLVCTGGNLFIFLGRIEINEDEQHCGIKMDTRPNPKE